MYCQCTKGNQFNVVGLGDVNSFDQTAGPNAWTQTTISEILPLPECYPEIEGIERIYINPVVNNVRFVKTPVPTTTGNPNEEGFTITGNKIIVNGNLCQTIVYTAADCEQTLHSINFKYPFCVSIILPPTTASDDPSEKEYCANILIEDVYAKALNSRTICKCVTMFIVPEVVEFKC